MAACCGPCAETCGLYFSKVLQTSSIQYLDIQIFKYPSIQIFQQLRCCNKPKFNTFWAMTKMLLEVTYLLSNILSLLILSIHKPFSEDKPIIWSQAKDFPNNVVASTGESSVPTSSRWGGGERHHDCLKLYNSDLSPSHLPVLIFISTFCLSCLLDVHCTISSRTITSFQYTQESENTFQCH